MPVILDGLETPVINTTTMTLPTNAVMLYPRDEKRRKLWYAAALAREYAACRAAGASEDALSPFHVCVPDLWEMPLAPSRVYQDGADRAERAALSGLVLLYMLRLSRHHPRHCKVERVKILLVEFPTPGARPPSSSLVEKSWAEFKNVSHFWASGILHQEDAKDGPVLGWIDFLKRAAGFRRAAEAARILSAAETWTHEIDILFQSEAEIDRLDPAKVAFLDREFPV